MTSNLSSKSKRAQVTIFIILAIIVVAGVVLYVTLGDRLDLGGIPKEVEPAYSYYLNCIEERVSEGASILGQQGGYIDAPEFEAGSDYMPFSSQLDF